MILSFEEILWHKQNDLCFITPAITSNTAGLMVSKSDSTVVSYSIFVSIPITLV